MRRASSATVMSIVPAVTIETRPSTRGMDFPTERLQRRRAGVVVRAAGKRERRDLFPAVGGQPRDEHVVRARELTADLRRPAPATSLRRGRFPESPRAAGGRNRACNRRPASDAIIFRAARLKRSRARSMVCALRRSLSSFGKGKRVKIPRGPRHCHRGRPGRQPLDARDRNRSRVREGARRRRIRKPGDLPDGTRSRSGYRMGRAYEFPQARDPLGPPETGLVEREVRMTTAVLLVLLGAFSRLIPHPPNFVALGALALYSGARLPKRLAIAVPLGAMALSDFVLDFGTGRARALVHAADDLRLLRRDRLRRPPGARTLRPARLRRSRLGASVFFFLTSNLAEWLADPIYPKTAAGLALCYAAAIPFFWNTLFADLLGTAVLFGLDALSRAANGRTPSAGRRPARRSFCFSCPRRRARRSPRRPPKTSSSRRRPFPTTRRTSGPPSPSSRGRSSRNTSRPWCRTSCAAFRGSICRRTARRGR